MQEETPKMDFVLKVDTATVGNLDLAMNPAKPAQVKDASVDQSVVSRPAIVQLPPKPKPN